MAIGAHPSFSAQVYMGFRSRQGLIEIGTINPNLIDELTATNRYHTLMGWPHKYAREYIDQYGDVAAYIGANTLDEGAEVVS